MFLTLLFQICVLTSVISCMTIRAAHTAKLDLVNRPADNLVLEQMLTTELVEGHYQEAIKLGLQHLNPFSMNLVNLRLLIQAARLDKQFDLADELIRLGRLLYPSDAHIDIEDRLVNLAKGECHEALKPIETVWLTASQRHILAQIDKQCPVEWQPSLQLSSWVAKPKRTRSGVSEIIAEDNSFIDQVCTVFSVGCGPIPVETVHAQSERIAVQAMWHLRHLRKDRHFEHIRLQFQKDRAIYGHVHSTQAHMQFGWQFDRPHYMLRPTIMMGLHQEEEGKRPAYSQLIHAGSVSLDVPIGRHLALMSHISRTHIDQEQNRTRIDLQENGLRWRITSSLELSHKTGRLNKIPPTNDNHGPSVTQSEHIGVASKLTPQLTISIRHAVHKEQFVRTLYYLTRPHQIVETHNTIQMDLSLKTDQIIWIKAEASKSTSADILHNYKQTRLSAGFRQLF